MGFDKAERPVTVANSMSGSNLISSNASARLSTINAGANVIRPPVMAGGALGNQIGTNQQFQNRNKSLVENQRASIKSMVERNRSSNIVYG